VKIFRNTALVILIVILLSLFSSMVVEINALNTSMHNLRTAMIVSSKYALESFSITQFSGFDDKMGSAYNIQDTHNRNAYISYLNSLEQQGNNHGFTALRSDFQSTIDFLKHEISAYSPSDPHSSVLSPFVFSWTFLEEKRLQKEFETCLQNIIDYNYNATGQSRQSLAFSGQNVLRLKSVTAKITDGPKLVNLTEGLNAYNPLYKTYLKLFGSTKTQAVNMINGINAFEVMYNYIITYDVEFSVEWEHHTVTPFFKAGGVGRTIAPQYLNENSQIKMDMQPMVITRQYTVIN